MELSETWLVILVAVLLDCIVGDPLFMPHPIRWMGRAIEICEPRFRRLPFHLTFSGAFFTLFLVLLVWAVSFAAVKLAYLAGHAAGVAVQVLLLYYCISIRCLNDYAMDVYQSLQKRDLDEARRRLSRIVGRETGRLSEKAVARGAVETVAENLVDGVVSPLFFAVLGGAPLAMAFKMASTLDSMVGYKNDAYRRFGTASARLDDVLNFIPARLAVPVIALAAHILAGRGRQALQTALHEGRRHASPNAGYPEAAFAGTLGIRLGGPHRYHGQVVVKPYIGTCLGPTDAIHIRRSCDLMFMAALIWLACLTAGILGFNAFGGF